MKKIKKIIILLIIILFLGVLVYANEINLTTKDVFQSLKDNNANEATAVFTIDNTELVSKEHFKIVFNEVCGKVNSYKILVEGVCTKKVPVLNMTITSCDKKTIYNESLKADQDVCPSPCFGNPEDGCYLETTVISYVDEIYECYGEFSKVPIGVNDYKIEADISLEVCENTGALGYQIDWIPCLNITNPLINSKVNYCQDEWAWWNTSLPNRYNITLTTETSFMPVAINGSHGYMINGKKNFIWYNPGSLGGLRSIYNGTNSVYAFANETTKGWWDNPRLGADFSYAADTVYYFGTLALHFENNGTWNGSANTGSWIDSSCYQLPGTLYAGSPVYVNDSRVGGAYDFNGTTKIIFADNPTLDKASDESISFIMWLYFNEVKEQGPFGKKDAASTGYYMYTGASGAEIYLQAGFRTDLGTGCDLDLDDAFLTDRWYHVAWVIDDVNTQARLYINGTSMLNKTNAHCGGSSDNADPFRLGTEQNQYGTPFNGIIDEFYISKQVLNHTAILDHYNNGRGLNNLLTANEAYSSPDIIPPIITISTPADFNWTNDNTPVIAFTATDETNTSFRCDLSFNGALAGYNQSVNNNTLTSLTVNDSLTFFNVYYYSVNCTDGNNNGSATYRTLYLYNGTTADAGACDLGCISLAPGCYATATVGCTLITNT